MTFTRRGFVAAFSCAAVWPTIIKKPAKKSAKQFVRAEGKSLLDPNGKKLLLRGINLGNWLEPEGYMFLFEGGPQSPREIEAFVNELVGPTEAETFWHDYRRLFITEADIKFLKQSGLNSVRIPFHYKFFVSGNEGFRLLDQVIGWCRQAGLWVILDMHCAPGGQTGTNIDDSWGYPWLYESEKDKEQLCQVWKRIAEHHSDDTTVIGYDLLNEPIPHFQQLQKYNSQLEPLYRRITRAIREVDADVRDAAKAIGLTGGQVLRRVEAPLAGRNGLVHDPELLCRTLSSALARSW